MESLFYKYFKGIACILLIFIFGKEFFVVMPHSTQNKGQQLIVVSRSWTNLYGLNYSFSLTSLGSKSASMFLEGDWHLSLTPSPGGWTPNLPITVLACELLPITLRGSSRLETTNFTASGPTCLAVTSLTFPNQSSYLCFELFFLKLHVKYSLQKSFKAGY